MASIQPTPAARLATFAVRKANTDGAKGHLSAQEFSAIGQDKAVFRRFDANGDGGVTSDEIAARLDRVPAAEQKRLSREITKNKTWIAPASGVGLFILGAALACAPLPGAAIMVANGLSFVGVAIGSIGGMIALALMKGKEHAKPILAAAGVATPAEAKAEAIQAEAERQVAQAQAAVEAARITPTKAGLTSRSDLLMSKGPLTIASLGSDKMAVADAKVDAKANDRAEIFVQRGEETFRISSLAFTVPTGTVPAVDETITVIGADGQKIEGKVVFVSQVAAPVAPPAPVQDAPSAPSSAPATVQRPRQSATDAYYERKMQQEKAEAVVNGIGLLFDLGKSTYKGAGFR